MHSINLCIMLVLINTNFYMSSFFLSRSSFGRHLTNTARATHGFLHTYETRRTFFSKEFSPWDYRHKTESWTQPQLQPQAKTKQYVQTKSWKAGSRISTEEAFSPSDHGIVPLQRLRVQKGRRWQQSREKVSPFRIWDLLHARGKKISIVLRASH